MTDSSEFIDTKEIQNKISVFSKIFHAVIRGQDVNFWILAAFVPTFIIARFIVHFFPALFLEIRGVHVHHLTYGIIILSVVGLLLLNFKKESTHAPLAFLYGIGLALAFDEFGMWLHLQDDYWIRQSYDAIIIITAALTITVYLPSFFSSIWHAIKKHYNTI